MYWGCIRCVIDFSKTCLYFDIFAFFPSSHPTFSWPGQESLDLESKWMKLQTCCQSCGLCSPIPQASPGRSRGGCSTWVAEICGFVFIILWGVFSKSSIPTLCTWQADSKQPCAAVNCHCLSTEKWQFSHCKTSPKEPHVLLEVGLLRGSSLTSLVCLNNTKSPKLGLE